MSRVVKFRLPDGQEHAWHGTEAALYKAYPDAVILGRLKMDDLGQGTWSPVDPESARKHASSKEETKAAVTELDAGEPDAAEKPKKTAK